MTVQVVFATHNENKLTELQRILSNTGIVLKKYTGPQPVENGTSFRDNALLKARAAAMHTGLPAIADDSGICVDVMGGAPGIFSARWSGPNAHSEENVRLLLWQLTDIAEEHRTAHFTCAAALVVPAASEEIVREGVWEGRILSSPVGEAGFGYDPVFAPNGLTESAAQMSLDEKNKLSHRTQAFSSLLPYIRRLA